MKSISSDLSTQQARLNRKPQSKIIFRDVMLRMDTDWVTNAYAPNFPDYADGDNIMQHPYDSDATTAGVAGFKRAWCVDTDTIMAGYVLQADDPFFWVSSIYSDYTEIGSPSFSFPTPDGVHRISVCGGWVFYGSSGDIVKGSCGGTTWSTFKSSAYTADTDHVALAAVTSSAVYMAVFTETGTFKYLTLYRIDNTGSVSTCPHTIIVDADYNESSLQWFDAERITSIGTDVLIVNARTHGYPLRVLYKDGVWSTPQPVMQMDDLSSTSYLRLGAVKNIEDSNGDEVLWATGTLSRGGSTGNYPASYDLCMRSKDGEHWTVDRYSYVCEDALCGKLLPYGNYVYYERGRTVMRAKKTWLMGYDNADLKLTVEDDIHGWTMNMPAAGAAIVGKTVLAAGDGTYNKDTELSETAPGRWNTVDSTLAIVPGMWMFRYAGYNGYDAVMSVEIADQCPGSYQLGQRRFDVRSRGAVMRSLYDWSSDQNWQLLSQVKHYDDCDKLDKLYSVSSGQIEVESDSDAEVKGDVDEIEFEDETGVLVFDSPNKPAINLCTKPSQTSNFRVKTRFSMNDDSGTSTFSSGYVSSTFWVDSGTGGSYQTDGDGYPYFEHAGQDFSDWAAQGTENSRYAIVVTNTDGTMTWGYLGTQADLESHQVEIINSGIVGDSRTESICAWGGASTSGRTPSSYAVFRSDSWARIGTGVGVCGCVSDQYNMIAAIPDIIGNYLYLVIRRGDEDEAIWIPWTRTAITRSSRKDEYYEVEMIRNGQNVQARMYYYPSSGGSRQDASAWIDEDWPLAEPMVVVDDEAYNQTDRGKVGVICTISTPETQLGSCPADRDWLPRSPDLFVRQVDYKEAGNDLFEDIYSTWEDFTNGCVWNGSYWVDSNRSLVPPFHFGGEDYDPVEDAKPYYTSKNHWSDQYGDTNLAGDVIESVEIRLTRVRISPTDYAIPYNGGNRDGALYESDDATLANYYAFVFNYGNESQDIWSESAYAHEDQHPQDKNMLPMYMVGDPHDDTAPGRTDPHDFQAAMANYSEMVTQVHTRDDEEIFWFDDMGSSAKQTFGLWYTEREYEDGEGLDWRDRFPNFTVYPGFYLPGRASIHEPQTAHPKGTIIRQHWNPKITLRGVWAYDDTIDKALEWTMKDIAYKAGVMDFDTEYSINTSVQPGLSSSSTVWINNTLGEQVYQKDFDLTLDMTGIRPDEPGEWVILVVRASARTTTPMNGNLAGWSGVAVGFGHDTSGPVLGAWQTNSSQSNWVLFDYVPVPGTELGSEVRFVGYKEFISVYNAGQLITTLHIGEIYGQDEDGYSSDLLSPGYIGLYKITTNSVGSITVTQPELYAWTDAIILDSRQNAIGGLQRCLRDRRIRFVETCAQTGQPSLRISNMSLRYTASNISDYTHWLGTITDHESTDVNYPSGGGHVSIFSDSTGETDRIPTHVRVVGYEVGDRIDHVSAAKYGILFQSHQCPNLEESEAYGEANRIVRDALSHSGSRKPTAAAQIDWEVEDALLLDYTPHDQGPDVSGYYIVDSMSFQYATEPKLQVVANLREMT